MTLKLSDRELERLLRGDDGAATRPPAGLLARLRADLPGELPLAPPVAETETETEPAAPAKVLRPVWGRRSLLSLAASLAVMVGGSFLAYRTFRESAGLGGAPEGMARDRIAAAAPAPVVKDKVLVEDQIKEEAPVLPAEVPPEAAAAQSAAAPKPQAPAAPPPALRKKAADVPQPVTVPEELTGAVVGGIPGGVPGGTAGGYADLGPAGPPAATVTAALEEKPEAEALRVDSDAPLRVETRSLELGSSAKLAEPESQPLDLRDAEGRRRARQLESPAIEGNAMRPERGIPPPPQAAAATREQRAPVKLDDATGDGWQAIEMSLAAGIWPTFEQIAAARQPPPSGLAGGKRASGRAGDANSDPVVKLREDCLAFFGKMEKNRSDLTPLRRRALKLAALRPSDPRMSDLVRMLNLASHLLPD